MKIKCPSCGFANIEGVDRCAECFHSMMNADLLRAKKKDQLQNVLMTMPISELLTGEDLLVASPNDPVAKVIEIFEEERKNCVLVYDHKKMVGILSNRDVLRRVAGRYDDLSKVKVGEVMTRDPEFVHPDEPIAFAVNKMALGGFRHVPVLNEDGTPVSIIMIQDVLTYLSHRKKIK